MSSSSAAYPRPFAVNWWGRLGWLLALVYGIYAADYLDVSWSRFVDGLGNGASFLGEMVPVDFSRWRLLISNLLETVEIAIIASAFGVCFSLPVGLLAARNEAQHCILELDTDLDVARLADRVDPER